MFKKLITLSLFLVFFSPAFAGNLAPVKMADVAPASKVAAMPSIEKNAMQPTKTAEIAQLSLNGNYTDIMPTDAWLISLALLGFIMLSNRSGV